MEDDLDADMKKEEENIFSKFEKETKDKLKIVDLLNSLYSIILNEYYKELEIKEDEKLIIFDLAQAKIEFLEQSLIEKDENSSFRLAITVFKNIFMSYNDFNLENFDNNIYAFNLIIKMLKEEKIEEEEKAKIINLTENMMKNKEYNYSNLNKILSRDLNFSYSIFCFILLINNSCSNKIFINEFLSLIKRIYKLNHKSNLEINQEYSESELNKISLVNVVNDLSSFFSDCDLLVNFLTIKIRDKHLVINLMGVDDVSKIINQEEKNKKVSEGKKQLKGEQKKMLKEEEKDLEHKKDDKSKDNKSENKKELDNKILEDKINQIEETMMNKIKQLERAIKNSKINLENVNNKYIKIDSELNIIKLRDLLKGLVDFLCKALNIITNNSYYFKVFLIKQEIKKKKIKNLNNSEINEFLDKLYIQLKYANKNAHSIDINMPILDQIFKYIDPKNKYKELKEELKKGKMNELLQRLSIINNSYSNVKKIIEKKESIIADIKGMGDIFVSD